MTPAVPASYEDRLELAAEWLRARFVERGEFLSDSDVYTASETFTTDDLEAAGALFDRLTEHMDDSSDPLDWEAVWLVHDEAVADRDRLREDLFSWLTDG